jgi:hypothetical protein
MQRQI